MEALNIRLLPFCRADGPHQMAVDEMLLESAIAGQASLRFYEWSPATLSLGYFQPVASILTDTRLATLPFVRRPSGGDAIVHHFELTYALALPACAVGPSASAWLRRMHDIIGVALSKIGVTTQSHPAGIGSGTKHTLCFLNPAPGDLLIAGHKVVGSAQRKRRGAVLQHGSILLDTSPHAPGLPGIRELAGNDLKAGDVQEAIVRAIAERWTWSLHPEESTDRERQSIRVLVAEKYGNYGWNRKR